MTYTYSVIYLAHWEKQEIAADLMKGAPGSSWQLPGIVLWIFFIIQFLVFPFLGAWVERRMHGITTSNTRNMVLNGPDSSDSVVLSYFSKHYEPNWWRRKVLPKFGYAKRDTVVAVNNLSFTALKGHITVLLGANGSGKSTTLDAIAGLGSVTKGSITVDGNGGLGLCPQKNVLWDQLTVLEHVQIFNRLKSTSTPAGLAQLKQLINDCDLERKMYAKAKTLSGGQKRKLQLAMMFTGGSHVCLVDEMSSGLDPLSRKKIQTIILRERGKRTVLLTTHFLDEADILSDQIIILSKGNLKAEGTAVHLKNIHGGGYRLQIHDSTARLPPEFSELNLVKSNDNRTLYELQSSSEASHFVRLLDQAGIANYQVFGPTVEDVFLKLAEEIQPVIQVEDEEPQAPTSQVLQEPLEGESGTTPVDSDTALKDSTPELLTGIGTGLTRQTRILFRKRLTILKRNFLPYLAAVLVPILAGGLVTLFLADFTSLSCDPKQQSSDPLGYNLANPLFSRYAKIVVGPSSRVPVDKVAKAYRIAPVNITVVETLTEFNDAIASKYNHTQPGGVFIGDDEDPLFAYRGNYGIEYAPMTQNLLDNILSGTSISTNYQPLAVPYAPNTGDSLQMVLYFGLAMAVYPGFFALYVTMERIRNVRALHYSNGIRSGSLWFAYMLFDSMFVVIVSVVVIGIFMGVSSSSYCHSSFALTGIQAWGGWWAPGYLFLVFLFYGLTSILVAYVLSLIVPSQLAAFAITAGLQAAAVALYFAM
jgi:ATP-binding cassette, subfamily A (ABC1), member 3